jgi:putative ABC transport system permease protein
MALLCILLHANHHLSAHLSAQGRGMSLLVGPPGSPTQRVLCVVLALERCPGLLSLPLVQNLANLPEVRAIIPLSLGDSIGNVRVLATSANWFSDGPGRGVVFSTGGPFREDPRALAAMVQELRTGIRDTSAPEPAFHVVLGSKAARDLGASVGSVLETNHGQAAAARAHDTSVGFEVIGVLAPTGPAIDDLVLTDLASFYAMPDHAAALLANGEPGITAALVVPRPGVHKARLLPHLQGRSDISVADVPAELLRLQDLLGPVAEMGSWLGGLIITCGVFGVAATFWVSLEGRRGEFAVLRLIGVQPLQLITLLCTESALLAGIGACSGITLAHLLMPILPGPLAWDPLFWLPQEFGAAGLVLLGACLGATFPATIATRRPLRRELEDHSA